MNKLFLILFFIVSISCVIPVFFVHGATISTSTKIETNFDININEIADIKDTNQTRFIFSPINITNLENIVYWKVRIFCEDSSTSISLNLIEGNDCGKAIKIQKTTDNKFFILFSNPLKKNVGFSFKLKAYDVNGKWLHSEKKSFRWK